MFEPMVVPKVNIVPSTPMVAGRISSPVVNAHHAVHHGGGGGGGGDRWQAAPSPIPEVDKSNVSPSKGMNSSVAFICYASQYFILVHKS